MNLKGEGGRCYRTGVCSKGEIKGRKINTASRVFTPARAASARGEGCVLPSQNKSCSVERCHNPGLGAGGQFSQGGPRLAPKPPHGVRQRPGVRAGVLSQDPLVRAERMGTRLRRSAPDGAVGPWGRDGLRSVTRGGWTLAWKMGAHLSREGEMGEAHRMGRG